MKQHVLWSYIVDGASEKVSQFIMSVNPIYYKNFSFNQQKYNFKCCGKIKTIKLSLKLNY